MKLSVNESGVIVLEEVFSSICIRTKEGKELYVCLRDFGFEMKMKDGERESEWKHFDEIDDLFDKEEEQSEAKKLMNKISNLGSINRRVMTHAKITGHHEGDELWAGVIFEPQTNWGVPYVGNIITCFISSLVDKEYIVHKWIGEVTASDSGESPSFCVGRLFNTKDVVNLISSKKSTSIFVYETKKNAP